MELLQKILLMWLNCADWIRRTVPPRFLQIVGYAATWIVYAVLVVLTFAGVPIERLLTMPWLGEILGIMLAVFAGIPELILILVFNTTITRFGRELLPKPVDVAIIVALFPFNWWRFGPVPAIMAFAHWIAGHYGEKQPEK